MIPAVIPINTLSILSNAKDLIALSAIEGIILVTKPVAKRVWNISQETSAEIPAVPSA